VTAQGHPRAIFKRAIEHGNVPAAEMTARELGRITLAESLALTALVVQKDPGRRSRYAVRWLRRLLEEDQNLTIEEDASLAASALAALGGRAHAEALSTLSALAECD
jgi:ribosomal protein S7